MSDLKPTCSQANSDHRKKETKARFALERCGCRVRELRGGAGGQDLAGVGAGEERDDGEVGKIPVFVEIEGEGDRGVEGDRDGLLFVKKPDNGGVLQRVARIFA
jgi:hypothetical protein